MTSTMTFRTASRTAMIDAINRCATPLTDDASLDGIMALVGDARFVLIGEASHGTHQFYEWRARLSKRLIAEKGFGFVAVEGDWPDCYRVNRYVKGYADAGANALEVLHAFDRWPTWMWANRETAAFAEWLRAYNLAHRDVSGRDGAGAGVGFFGLDVYSLWDSMREVVSYLDRVDPSAAANARNAYACFDPFHGDEQAYARATALVPMSCEKEAVRTLIELRTNVQDTIAAHDDDELREFFNAEQNALIAANAERYYRAMVRGGAGSWNTRDGHMMQTLERLVDHHGAGAKAIVWEHNTHIGDARYTDMRRSKMVNVGQLTREAHGETPRDGDGVVLVGFGTYEGRVMAADEWGAPMRSMRVPDAPPESFEGLVHEAGSGADCVMLFTSREAETARDPHDRHVALDALDRPLGHRAIGVVYDPAYERYGNWVPTVVPKRYDAFLYIERTTALQALHVEERETSHLEEETFPTGM